MCDLGINLNIMTPVYHKGFVRIMVRGTSKGTDILWVQKVINKTQACIVYKTVHMHSG